MKPKYLRIRDDLTARFIREDYRDGQRLPTEQELVSEFSVSRTTIRQALAVLEREHLIRRVHGSGSYYIEMPVDQGAEGSGTARKQPPRLIGLLNFFQLEYIYPEIIGGIEDVLAAEGYSLVIASSNQNDLRQTGSIRRLLDQNIAGLILEPNRILQIEDDHPVFEMVESAGIPVVTTHWGGSNKKISTVTIDDEQAGYIAGRYLADRGHRSIGMLYKEDVQAGHDRFCGFQRALKQAGIDITDERIKTFDNDDELREPRQGYIKTMELLQQPDLSAIFYFNDQYALQGYAAIRERGLKIPDDISVIGFDNFNTTEMVDPPLTTFEHPKYELGKWAARILLDEISAGKKRLPMKMIFEPVLVERESVRTIP